MSIPPPPALKLPIILATMLLWLGGIWLFSRHNDFPIYYHPDETSKGRQIISGELNFHHPLLLLDTAGLLLRLSGEPRTVENAVFAGRWASAIFASTSVLCLAGLAWRRGGWLAALLALALVTMHPLLYELAHYCKEDPALLLGLSLSLLMLDVFLCRPTPGTAALLGSAAGLAVSGKYLGVVMLPVLLPLLLWRGRAEKGRLLPLLGAFLGAFLGMVLLINLPYFLHPSALQKGLGYEINAAQIGGTKGLSREVPHGKYIGIFLDNVGWPLWIGMAVFALGWFLRKDRRRAGDLLLLIFPLAYALLLSFSPKTASRYFLAVSPFLIVAGCLGISWIGDLTPRLPRWSRGGLVLIAAITAIVVQIGVVAPSWQGVRTDSRREMAEWINVHLPPDSHLLAESRIHLSKQPTWHGKKRPDLVIQEEQFVPDRGTLPELAAGGVRYVAVIRTSFGGFMDRKRKPVKSLEQQHQRRSEFYWQLFNEARLLQKTGGGGVGILNPEIRLYELPDVRG